jgi:hypothetical protein
MFGKLQTLRAIGQTCQVTRSKRSCVNLPAIRQRRIVRKVFTFIESSVFERVLPSYLDDDEYSDLQQFLIQNPDAGELVPGSGGVRKMRWARPEPESEADCVSSISYGISRTSSGC